MIFQSKLELPCTLRAGDAPEVADAELAVADDLSRHRCFGSIQNRRVGKVDGLSPKFQILVLRDDEPLRQAQVSRMESRAANRTVSTGPKCV